MGQPLIVKPGKKVKLEEFDTDFTGGLDRDAAEAKTAKHIQEMSQLSDRLYAEGRRSVLLVLQGMDTSGKDGTIRHVMGGVSPQACQVVAFKAPSALELEHDFLWRVHQQVPPRGRIGIFNRSHYEDVLVVRVHNLVPKEQWRERYDHINAFESFITSGGVQLVKVYLHISKGEQKRRLQERLDKPEKRWKFNKTDLLERNLWGDYQHAYEDALTRCNTELAPWHIVPADNKWYRNYAVSKLLLDTLKEMDPQYPPDQEGLDRIVVE